MAKTISKSKTYNMSKLLHEVEQQSRSLENLNTVKQTMPSSIINTPDSSSNLVPICTQTMMDFHHKRKNIKSSNLVSRNYMAK